MKSESAYHIHIQHVFDQRALQYAKENKKYNEQNKQSYIVFKIQNEHFGISHSNCQRVLNNQKITSIPFSQSYIKGVVHYHGKLIAAIDLLTFFGYAETILSSNQSVIVVKEGDIQFCILADEIVGLEKYAENELVGSLSSEFSVNKKYILGIQHGNVAIINAKEIMDELIMSEK